MKASPVRAVPLGVKAASGVIFIHAFLGGLKAPFLHAAVNQSGVAGAAIFSAAVSLFGMMGNFLVSRLSDRFTRRQLLWVAFGSWEVSTLTAVLLPNTLWPALPATLAQFFGVLKALIADYCHSMEANLAETGHWISALNLTVSLGGLLAPVLAHSLASSMEEVDRISLVAGLVLMAPCVACLREPERTQREKTWTARRLLRMRAWRTPATRWMSLWLLLLAGGYHCFQTINMPSLIQRFGANAWSFGLLQLAMGLGGTVGTLISGPVIERFCADGPVAMLTVQTLLLWLCRCVAWLSPNFEGVALAYFVLFVDIGILNVYKGILWTAFAPQDELGGVFGLQESIEGGLSGLLFPVVTGVVEAHFGATAVLVGLSAMYVVLLLMVQIGYNRYVLPSIQSVAAQKKQKAS